MIDSLIRLSYRLAFPVFVVALAFSLVYGLYFLWNPSLMTETSGRILSTALILVLAALFYTGLCDAWFRITGSGHKADYK